LAWGTNSENHLDPLWGQIEAADAGEVTPLPGETRDEAQPDRVAARKDDRNRRCHGFRRLCRRSAGERRDHLDLAADEVGGQCRQPIGVALRPAVFDRDVLTFDVAGFVQSLAERGHIRGNRIGRRGAEDADHRHRLLLRARWLARARGRVRPENRGVSSPSPPIERWGRN
jgi:hypothetical protein